MGLKYIDFICDYLNFKKLSKKLKRRFDFRWKDRYPCLNEKIPSHDIEPHYTYHPAWAARILAQVKPEIHIDISSSLFFCTIVSAFVPVKFYEYRSTNLNLDNLSSRSANLLHLPFEDESIESLSCMHVIEHIGLGRYGDPIDPDGDLKAIFELKRVLAVRGSLIFVVPMGKPKIMFNAHRIYSYDQIVDYFAELKLKEFSLITEDNKKGGLLRHSTKEMADQEVYGCGCFWFKKERSSWKPSK